MEQTGKISKKVISEQLRKHGAQIYGALPDGTAITRVEALSELLWKKALGYEAEVTDDEGNRKMVKYESQSWAVQAVIDRCEGKPISLIEVNDEELIAHDKVTGMVRDRMNQIAKSSKEVKEDGQG